MAHFVGGEVNPKLPEGCFDIRYEVKQLTRARVERFKATDDADHEPLTEAEFEILFKNSHSERVSFAMVGLGNDEVELFAPLLDPGRRHGIEGMPLPHAGSKYCISLFLNNNKIGERGIETLTNALEQNTTLTELYLQYNKIGDSGCKHIGRLLQRNRRLRKLDLGANGISEVGLADVLDGLQDNGVIESIGLFGNAPDTQDDLARVAQRLMPEARRQRNIGIQVKNKFRELIEEKLTKDGKLTILPWEEKLWEQISDELSEFFSNTDGTEATEREGVKTSAKPSAKKLLMIPRLDPGESAKLKEGPGNAAPLTVKAGRDEPLIFKVLKGDLARSEGAKADTELEYTDPQTGKPARAWVSDDAVKRQLAERTTSIVTYLNPMVMFPSKPRFRGLSYTDEAGAQYICCAGPLGAALGACPYRPSYKVKGELLGSKYHYALERDRETGRFFLQGYGQCHRLEEQGAEGGEGIPKHVVRAAKVDKIFALEGGESPAQWMDDVGDSNGEALPFAMKLSTAQAHVLAQGGVNAMHIRAIPPHPNFVPWRIAHVHYQVEAVAEAWAKLFIASEYSKMVSDRPFSPFNVVSRTEVAKLLVGVTLKEDDKGGKGDAKTGSNVRFMCDKCYDSMITNLPKGAAPNLGKPDAAYDK